MPIKEFPQLVLRRMAELDVQCSNQARQNFMWDNYQLPLVEKRIRLTYDDETIVVK